MDQTLDQEYVYSVLDYKNASFVSNYTNDVFNKIKNKFNLTNVEIFEDYQKNTVDEFLTEEYWNNDKLQHWYAQSKNNKSMDGFFTIKKETDNEYFIENLLSKNFDIDMDVLNIMIQKIMNIARENKISRVEMAVFDQWKELKQICSRLGFTHTKSLFIPPQILIVFIGKDL